LIDGEAIVVNADGLSVFDLLRHRHHDEAAILCAFDLIELDGENLKWSTLENRKGLLADVLKGTADGIAFNAHFDCEGATIFKHACMLGFEGIVSKRLGSHYRSGRVDHWLKIKNSKSPAVRRERTTGALNAGQPGVGGNDRGTAGCPGGTIWRCRDFW